MIHELLSAALRRATDALGSHDATAAAGALQDAAAACESALRQGLRLEPAHVRALRPIYADCGRAMDATRRRLSDAMGAFGHARCAGKAYRR